jgi:hypothetical protein
MAMLAPWVLDEIKTARLNDERLNKRFLAMVDRLGKHPTASIPAACGGAAETAAAYRWFDNEKVTFDKVLQPHIDSTRRRIAAQSTVVLAQDTTEVDVTRPEQQVEGAGPLDGASRRGVFLHLLHAFTPDRTPLGTVHATTIVRSDDAPVNATKSRADRRAIPIEDKESYRWVVALRQAQEEARQHPQTQFICVADSEGDIYELLVEGMAGPQNAHWIVRASQDRALQPDSQTESESADFLRDELLAAPVLYTDRITVRGRKAKVSCDKRERRQPRESREAEVEIRAARLTLRPPPRPGHKLNPVAINAVMVRELNPPKDEPPVEWILLSDLPIDTVEQVRELVRSYTVRWVIEIFFRTLKSGCRVEDRRFEHIDRFLPCLAVYLIITWRTLFVCHLGRECPDISCEAVFEPAEWKSVYRVVLGKSPRTAPKLQEMVRTVAQLGGYINRKRPDPPGPQTVWLGLQRLHDIATCWKLFGPEVNHRRKLV